MAGETNIGCHCFEVLDRSAEAVTILRGCGWGRRAEGLALAKGQVVTEDKEANGSESFGCFDEQMRLGVGTRAVGEDKGVAIGLRGYVKEFCDHASRVAKLKAHGFAKQARLAARHFHFLAAFESELQTP